MTKSESILEKYYVGLTEQIRAEIEHITSVIKHQVEKGRSNEQILIDLLKKFLPKKYAIGTGIVIDGQGNQSKQCDVIIYDNYFNPDLLSQRVIQMYPIEAVYAVIQVKTNLRNRDIADSIENIGSVKKLEFQKTQIPFWDMTENNAITPKVYHTFHPFGFIFAYKSDDIKEPSTIKDNFIENMTNLPEKERFDLAFIMDKSLFIARGDLFKEGTTNEHKAAIFQKIDGTDGVDPDPARGFLNFLIVIYDLLNSKRIQPINITKHYLPEGFTGCKIIDI